MAASCLTFSSTRTPIQFNFIANSQLLASTIRRDHGVAKEETAPHFDFLPRAGF